MPNDDVRRRVVVKFRDAVNLPYEDGAERYLDRLDAGLRTELQQFGDVRLNRLFKVMRPERIGELVSQASKRDKYYRAPNFLSFFVIDTPDGADPVALTAALRKWSQVQEVYIDPLDRSPNPPSTNPFYAQQIYLKPPATAAPPAPQGAIDAEFAWLQSGGRGTNQKLVDLERGAKLDQEDIVNRNIQLLHGINNDADRVHGARVLCIVVGEDNQIGVIGIAPDIAEVAYTCQVLNALGTVNRPAAVMKAIDHFGADPVGRVLLLEVELGIPNDLLSLIDVNGRVWTGMPMETTLADYEAIRLATALGIVVVEAAGNGNNKLDDFQQASSGQFVLARPGGRADSGAIMVGGSTSTFPYQRAVKVSPQGVVEGSCYGNRVDCFAWASDVMTYFVDPLTLQEGYAAAFGGTSAAAAIVAGAALLVEGVAENTGGRRLDPGQLRALLSDPAPNGNTPSDTPAQDLIGVMPNLKYILQNALPVAPDVYIRDYVGDVGMVHAGAISLSPDVIVRPIADAAPAVTFGPGTENNLMLGPTVTSGQDNFVYVRVWNRTAIAATNVTATAFYAEPATLITADDWKLIGSVVIANVPPGNVMTVSDAIIWPGANVPPPGHYCFIALVGNAQDPVPPRANFLNFDYYAAYIRNNNNVTWRNFDVVTPLTAAAPLGATAAAFELVFVAPGALDAERSFQLRVAADLPPAAHVSLEVPLALIGGRVPLENIDIARQTGQVVIPRGGAQLPTIPFPAKSRFRCRLLVRIPRAVGGGGYRVSVSQIYQDYEVGRITRQLDC
jgi:serine protease